jgi:Zn-finger nucleic acid-binding protein
VPGLAGHACPTCEGIFLRSTDYWAWRDQQAGDLPDQPDPTPVALDRETSRAKQCPYCQHLLLPYRIAVDLVFTIDHCDACNSMWFDRGEWQTMQRRNLHDNLHQMFAAPWQRRLRQVQHRQAMAAIYTEKFGEDGYAEARRVKAWLDAHPHAAALRAYLNAPDPYQS